MRCTASGILLVAFVAHATFARAQDVDSPEQLSTWASEAEADFEYDRAIELWNTVIAHPDVTQAQRLKASAHAGSIERIRGNQLQARIHFLYVLDRNIDYLLPAETEPKITQFFEMIRAEMRQKAEAKASAAASAIEDRADVAGESADDDDEPASGAPGGLIYAGGAAVGLGVIAVGLAGTSGYLSDTEQDAALQSSVQLEREQHYDQRDLYSNLANGGLAAGGVLLMLGAGMILVDVTSAEPAQ